MPKRLSDITHAFERTSEALEDAQDEMTRVVELARAATDARAQARLEAHTELYRYLKDHPDEIVVASDYGYHFDRGEIRRRKVTWAHHEWVEDPAPAPTYRVPTAPPAAFLAELERLKATVDPDPLPAMATAWGTVEPRAGEAEEDTEGFDDTEPNGQPLTICPD